MLKEKHFLSCKFIYLFLFFWKKITEALVFCSECVAGLCRCLGFKMLGQTPELVFRLLCCPVSCTLWQCGTMTLQQSMSTFFSDYMSFCKTLKWVLASFLSCLPNFLQDICFKIGKRHVREEHRKLNLKLNVAKVFWFS